jgi:hypothetical protein
MGKTHSAHHRLSGRHGDGYKLLQAIERIVTNPIFTLCAVEIEDIVHGRFSVFEIADMAGQQPNCAQVSLQSQ